ncbi:MAG: lytic transglycosylase domain-containing protein [Deltaproteobacteria bacterium]|nr:lytic transglycosylase domain-containing protein [Deltaproteobacteria bacterium]
MALGTRLTVLDYLGTQKSADVWEHKQRLLKQLSLPYEKKFAGALSACLTEKKTSGLNAADYLSTPVRIKHDIDAHFLKPRQEGKNVQIKAASDRVPSKTITGNTGEQGDVESESSKQVSVRGAIEHSINRASRKYDLPSKLIRGVIKAESDFQVRAESSAGALGLMQLMPLTAQELGVKDPFDIDQNIDAGARYLKNMLERFGNDTRKALAAYNAGPGTVERYDGDVPYKETRRYVEKVLEFSGITA